MDVLGLARTGLNLALEYGDWAINQPTMQRTYQAAITTFRDITDFETYEGKLNIALIISGTYSAINSLEHPPQTIGTSEVLAFGWQTMKIYGFLIIISHPLTYLANMHQEFRREGIAQAPAVNAHDGITDTTGDPTA